MHFDGTISLGAIAIIVSMVITVGGVGYKIVSAITTMQNRQDGFDTWIENHEQLTIQQSKALETFGSEIKNIATNVSYLRGFADGRVQAKESTNDSR